MALEVLFVYGSLKRGGLHHDQLRSARFLGEAQTEPGYALTRGPGDYLSMVRVPSREPVASVRGELFEIETSLLTALDEFEGEEYCRDIVRVALVADEQGRPVPYAALAYLGKPR